ncbi:MAG TPA: cytochrome P450 [Dehalococcoidia bacterium]|jgi:cytochrome P450|nr:cytochrome P450 [Dehalococcoidia bacterium]
MVDWKPDRPSYLKNPYPALARLRKEDPVHWDSKFEAWVLTKYEDCDTVLKQPSVFSSDANAAIRHNRSILARQLTGTLDGNRQGDVPFIRTGLEEHKHQRALASPAYNVNHYGQIVKEIAWKWTHGAVSAAQGESFEAMSGIANQAVVETVYELLGTSPGERSNYESLGTTIQAWRAHSGAGPIVRSQGVRAQAALRDVCKHAVSTNSAPNGAIALLRDAIEVGSISEEDAAKLLFDLSIAGNNATAFLIGLMLWILAITPDLFERLKVQPELTALAVIEALRWQGPTQFIPRFATETTSLGNRTIKPGEGVLAVVTAAGRDPERFERPDEFLLDRSFRGQLQFGSGEHHCIGAGAAMGLAEQAILAMLSVTDTPPLIQKIEWGGTMTLRGFKSLYLKV